MKRKLISSLVLSTFLFSTSPVAVLASNQTTVPAVEIEIESQSDAVEVSFGEPGITPDKSFYGVKRLLEKVQLYLVFSPEDRANLLVELAQKRLVEAKVMDDKGKEELVEKLINEYASNLLAAQENLNKASVDFKDLNEVLSKIEILLTVHLDLLEDIKSRLPEVQENINIIRDNLTIIKSTIKFVEKIEKEAADAEELQDGNEKEEAIEEENQDINKEENQKEDSKKEKVEQSRTKNFGVGELKFIEILAKEAGKKEEEIIKLREAGLGWGNVAKELGLSLGVVARELNKYVLLLDEEAKEEDLSIGVKGSEQDEETLAQLIKAIRPDKDTDVKELRKRLEKAKEKINENKKTGPPSFVEELINSRR